MIEILSTILKLIKRTLLYLNCLKKNLFRQMMNDLGLLTAGQDIFHGACWNYPFECQSIQTPSVLPDGN